MEAGPRRSDDSTLPLSGATDAEVSRGETTRSHEHGAYADGPESYGELRPPRRLRLWQIAPVVALAATGSLMFAFPLAFEFGGGGAVVAMLGLLICCCAAGWGMMAARRVGLTWPGLPPRGSGSRADWRVVLLYTVVVTATVVLAIWRVATLR